MSAVSIQKLGQTSVETLLDCRTFLTVNKLIRCTY